jgi:hypothetical protein
MALLVPDKPPVRIGNRAEKLECTIILKRLYLWIRVKGELAIHSSTSRRASLSGIQIGTRENFSSGLFVMVLCPEGGRRTSH